MMRYGWLGVLIVGCRDKADTLEPPDTGPAEVVDFDGDGYLSEEAGGDDCDDANSTVHPGAAEICDGIDNNCDGAIDEGVMSTFYADEDADGFGDSEAELESCSEPSGYVGIGNDCNDQDADSYPGASERCDGEDNDCDDEIDEGVTEVWYADADGDSYGDPEAVLEDCDPPSGYVSDSTDCDDTAAESYPDAEEVCDESDNDCDGEVDEGVTETYYVDGDGDRYGNSDSTTEACTLPSGYAELSGDCDDTDGDTYPGALEYCDGDDDDCDKAVDEDDAIDAPTWYRDSDTDGFGDASDTRTACAQPSGYVSDDTDCDDLNSDTYPGAPEYCDDEDDDCDRSTDEDAVDAPTWYIDYDSDGYGSTSYTISQCEQPSGYVSDDTDCDDTASAINPGAPEYCDGTDTNCDGTDDNDDAEDALTWYRDSDSDGYGDAANTTTSCSQPSGYLSDSSDCDDTEPTAYPGSNETEVPGDGVDTDCDGLDVCTDLNCDGLPDLVQGVYYSGSSHATSSRLYFNTGAGFADTDVSTVPTLGAYDSAVSDLNGDGYQDIVFANYYNNSTRLIDSYVYYGSATGYSSSNRDDLPTLGTLYPLIDDLDGDGYEDIVFANYYNDSSYAIDSYVYYGSATGYSTADRDELPGAGARRAASADFDNDGYKDIVLCNYYNGGYAVDSYVYYGSSRGYSSKDRDSLPTLGCRDIQLGDLNDDGYEDIVFANYYSGSSHSTSSYIYYGSVSGFSTAYRESLPTVGSLAAAIADFDQDGYDDVVFGSYYTGSWSTIGTTYVYYNSSLGFSSSIYDSFSLYGIWRPEVADLDNNGYPDLILPSYYSGSSYASNSYVYYGASTGFASYDALSTNGASKVDVGDVDQDGIPELVFNNYYSGSWSTLVDTYVYYGLTTGYSASYRDELATQGSWPVPVLVGNTDW